MKVNGLTFASEAEEFAEIQGPVSEIVQYWRYQVVENDRLVYAS
jgi:hypothetical protein